MPDNDNGNQPPIRLSLRDIGRYMTPEMSEAELREFWEKEMHAF